MRCEVYPRVCGGTDNERAARIVESGLSPRVRGNPDAGLNPGDVIGSIPACAGEPVNGVPRRRIYAVYPRVCGGTLSGLVITDSYYGLSPRVRGNR